MPEQRVEGMRGGEREREKGAPERGRGTGRTRGRMGRGVTAGGEDILVSFFPSCRKKKKEKEEKHEAGRAAFSFFFFSFFFSSGRRREKKTVNEKNDSDGGENKTRHKNQSHLERERVSR